MRKATPHFTVHHATIFLVRESYQRPPNPCNTTPRLNVQRGRHRWRSLAARQVAGRRVKPGQRTRCRSEARQIDAVEPGART